MLEGSCLPVALALWSFLIFVVQGTNLEHPVQTLQQGDKFDGENGWTPRPTKQARLDSRAEGFESLDMLFARQDSVKHTCGYINGQEDSPLICGADTGSDSTAGCASAIDDPAGSSGVYECCPYTSGVLGQCAFVTACLSYGDSANNNTATTPYRYGYTVMCAPSQPSCVTVNLITAPYTFSNLRCDLTSTLFVAFATTTTGTITITNAVTVSSPHTTTVPPTTSSTGIPPITSHPTSAASSQPTGFQLTASTTNQPTQSPSPTDIPPPSSLNVGAIAGGVVGGVVAFCAVGLLIYCCRGCGSRDNRNAVEL